MDKLEKIKFSICLPTDLVIKIDMLAQEKKIKYRNDVLKIIIESFFENLNNEKKLHETIKEMQIRLNKIENKLRVTNKRNPLNS